MKKNLVIGAVGDNSLHKCWIKGHTSYDLFLIYYGDGEGYEGDSKYFRRAKGFKYHLIQDVLNECPELFDYEYVWLPDDDIYATSVEIDRLFGMMKQFDLWLAQPSIMGYYGVEITLHQMGSLIRFTNWVEIMCPCFSSKALQTCKDVFKENKTGWSIETIWNVLLGHPRDRIAIIDDIVVFHTRAVMKGETYRGKPSPLSEAMAEAEAVYAKWNLDKEMEKDRSHGAETGGEVYCSVVYKQIKRKLEGTMPKHLRFWPPCNTLQIAVDNIKSLDSLISETCTSSNPDATVCGSLQQNDMLNVML